MLKLDPQFPNLMRAVFQTQPEVAHIYLGSKRHVLETIFNDKNEPFWRSAKRVEIGMIPTDKFRSYIERRFDGTDRGIREEAIERLLGATGGHPYAHPGARLLRLGAGSERALCQPGRMSSGR